MGSKTEISWTDATWSPVMGCTRVSPACKFCYAESMMGRFIETKEGDPMYAKGFVKRTKSGARWTNHVAIVPERLDQPKHWKRPRRIFVNSVSDTFHEGLDPGDIVLIYDTMAACQIHTFQVLTKRPRRRKEIFATWWKSAPSHVALPNVWEGTSVGVCSDLWFVDELRETPAAVRFLSLEPLIENLGEIDLSGIHQIIIGGESGPGARPMRREWAESLIAQGKAAGCKVFVKQTGNVLAREMGLQDRKGAKMAEWPVEFQVQEFPGVDVIADPVPPKGQMSLGVPEASEAKRWRV